MPHEADLPFMEQPGPDQDFSGITRREFIGQVAAATAGCALVPDLLAQTSASESDAANRITLTLTVNGEARMLNLDPRMSLLDALREKLLLPGTKKGCDHGQCGACTILVNDRRINSCLTLAAMWQNARITTIEGLADGEKLHPIQAAFIKHDAFQCGYCTPGQICSAVGLLKEGQAHTEDDVRELMSGNLCRCGAYRNILAAVREVQAGP